jgi:hypothetical protein
MFNGAVVGWLKLERCPEDPQDKLQNKTKLVTIDYGKIKASENLH